MRRSTVALALAATLVATATGAHAQSEPPASPASAEEPAAAAIPVPGSETAAAPAPERGDGGIEAGGSGDGPGDAKPGAGKGEGGDGKQKGEGSRRGRGRGRGELRLLRAETRPSKAWFKGRPATFRYAIDGRRKRDLVIQVKRKGRKQRIVRRFERDGVRPRRVHEVKWDGRVDGRKKYARQGNYKFKVRAKHGAPADARHATGSARTGFFQHKFPVRGSHTYGDGIGAGRGHRGVDVFAACGTRMQAARAGKVQYEAFQGSGAGHYLVIDGKRDRKDYVYMHLQSASPLSPGDRVRTGQAIGRVGETGNASGCHLHFELWSPPGWYEGGSFLDPMPKLHAWDRWS